MPFEVTYTQVAGPPSTDFEAYAERAKRELAALLDSNAEERKLQEFLRNNPSFVPGAWTPGTKSGHMPLFGCLVEQPKLPGFQMRVPDFMWLSTHSGTWYAAMIEIERPGKRLFTNQGIPSAEFWQARNQLNQWRAWLNESANRQLFIDEYGIPLNIRRHRTMDLHLILVFGRRSEFEAKPELSKHRGTLINGPNEELISWDRLAPDRDLCDVLTVRATGSGRFKVIAVPETFSLSPNNAEYLLNLSGIDAAIDGNPNISAARATFLRDRIPYWTNWAKNDGSKFTNGGAFRE